MNEDRLPPHNVVELYPGFTLNMSNIKAVKRTQYKPIGANSDHYYVNVTTTDGLQIEVIETKNEDKAIEVYMKIVEFMKEIDSLPTQELTFTNKDYTLKLKE